MSVMTVRRRNGNLYSQAFLVVVFITTSAGFAAPTLPDPRAGEIGGRVAIMGIPIIAGPGSATTPLSTANCEVHMARSNDETQEYVYPCGKWFQPPTGRYLLWLEKEGSISFQRVVYYAGERFGRAGHVFMNTLHPAGSVKLDPTTKMPAGSTFRLLSLDPVRDSRPFDRRIASVHANRQVAIPIGRVIAGVFDRDGRVLSLSKPKRVEAGIVTAVSPEKPENGRAALLAVLNRYVAPRALPVCEGSLILPDSSEEHPSVDLQAHDRVVLVWYDLPLASVARLELRCGGRLPFTQDVGLHAGAIVGVRADLPKGPENRQ